MASLVDANVLVYRFDSRFPAKLKAAEDLLFQGIADLSLRVAHQAIVEFVSAVTRPLGEDAPLLEPAEARREAEEVPPSWWCLASCREGWSFPSTSLRARNGLESGHSEVAVEGEGAGDPSSFHEGEGDAVGEAHLLILVLLEEGQGAKLVVGVGAEELQGAGRVDPAPNLGRRSVACSAAYEGHGLVHHEGARQAALVGVGELLPDLDGSIVVLVPGDVPADERSGVDEDHPPSP